MAEGKGNGPVKATKQYTQSDVQGKTRSELNAMKRYQDSIRTSYKEINDITTTTPWDTIRRQNVDLINAELAKLGEDFSSDLGLAFYTMMGHVFEFHVYSAIHRFIEDCINKPPRVTIQEAISAAGKFVYQSDIKVQNVTNVPQEIAGTTAAQREQKIRNWYSAMVSEENIDVAKTIERCYDCVIWAAQEVVRNFLKKKLMDLSKVENLQYQINAKFLEIGIIADNGGKGNPQGDLVLKVGNEYLILELKWQNGGSDAPFDWFSKMAETRLFGSKTYTEVLQKNKKTFWPLSLQKDAFISRLTEDALLTALNKTTGSASNARIGGGRIAGIKAQNITQWLIKKGAVASEEIEHTGGKTLNDLSKITLHLNNTRAVLDFKNMDIEKMLVKPRKGKFELQTAKHKVQFIYKLSGTPYLFGEVKEASMVPKTAKITDDEFNAIRDAGPDNYRYNFEMLFYQKMLNLFINEVDSSTR